MVPRTRTLVWASAAMLTSVLLAGLNAAPWAENPPSSPTADTTSPATASAEGRQFNGAPSQATLPLTKIVLYASGVGYFQRDGQIDGRGQVALRFKVDN